MQMIFFKDIVLCTVEKGTFVNKYLIYKTCFLELYYNSDSYLIDAQ